MKRYKFEAAAQIALRVTLGLGFLSAVADRFGLYGAPGEPRVAWGDWNKFVSYTALLVPFADGLLLQFAASTATFLEVLFGAALLAGRFVPQAAFGSSALLTLFGLFMALNVDFTAPFDYSVFTAAAAALFLGLKYRHPGTQQA